MADLVIKGGTVLDKSGSRKADVAIGADGNISQIATDIDGEREVDAAGCIVSSGLVDLNSDFCQPGNEEIETIESGTRSAVLGGYTAVMLMPHTSPAIHSAAAVKEMQSLRSEALCHIELSGSLTLDGLGDALSPIGEMANLGVRFFTHSNLATLDLSLLRRAMEYSSRFNVTIGLTPFVGGNGHMNEGNVSSDLGIRGVAIEEEEILTYQFVKMAKLTGARVHLQQVSSPKAIEIISGARADGVSVTCEGGLDLVGTTHTLFRTPGVATTLENYESSIHGGYRRINGFSKFGNNTPDGTTSNIEGIQSYAKGVVACQGTNIFYSADGTTWTQVNKDTYQNKTGTVSVTAGSATVTGSGTSFTTEFSVGDDI